MARTPKLPAIPIGLKDIFTPKQWKGLDSTERDFLAASEWQDPSNFLANAISAEEIVSLQTLSTDDSKAQDVNWRTLQLFIYLKYKTFGPLNAAINSKADYVAESGFGMYSDFLEVNEFLNDLNNSFRNRLYSSYVDWIIRMLSESENFILIALDGTGTATIRNYEPSKIGQGDDSGLITDPDDVAQTLFYRYFGSGEEEWIPDVRFILEPEYMLERQKALGDKFKKELIKPLTLGKGIKGNFNAVGGYRRFILHWKNLTGTKNIKRDLSSLSTTIEWINLYVKAQKWNLDYLRALSAYTINVIFSDSPAGKIAWHIWNKMTDEQKAATGLTKPLSPGSRVFLMPGITLKLEAPQLQGMSGSTQELLNLAGSGARTPQDLYQGQSADQTYAAIKTSRPPLIAEIENLQSKFEKFLRFEFLRACFKAKVALGGSFIALDGVTKHKLLPAYKVPWVAQVKKGKPTIKQISVEPVNENVLRFTFPRVDLDSQPQQTAGAILGSKHTGIHGLGVSAETAAKRMGVDDISRQRRKKLIEVEEFGEPVTAGETEQALEEKSPSKSKGKGKKEAPEAPDEV